MWGKVSILAEEIPYFRFNPTHVGKRRVVMRPICVMPVQPHACGEKTKKMIYYFKSPGSTPRMWGKVLSGPHNRGNFRFNPTHVGKRASTCSAWEICSVQPHACGEKSIRLRGHKSLTGSTPRMWGKGSTVSKDIPRSRFNPTHVGKSTINQVYGFGYSVQPHACGEKQPWKDRALYSRRFNPTHVGKRLE